MTLNGCCRVLLCVLILIYSFVCCCCESPIVVRGNRLINSETGHRFIVKGSGYDYDVSNSNEHRWRPAINALLSAVPQLNVIRLYEVDATLQYDYFMHYLNERHIYAIIPLTPSKGWCTLNRDGVPTLHTNNSCYPSCLLMFGQHVVNLFSIFPNTLAFTIGNEIINSEQRWQAAPCIKAYTYDIKSFMTRCSNEEATRIIPLLYAAADNSMSTFTAEDNDRLKLDYLTCGSDTLSHVDIFGLNLFRWCSDECTYQRCGSSKVYAALRSSPIPLLETELGCADFYYHTGSGVGNESVATRKGVNDWSEIAVLYAAPMIYAFSGGISYTYGVRGGTDFAFFLRGGRAATSTPGLEKNCGYPHQNCRVDLFARQLAALPQRETSHPQPVYDRGAVNMADQAVACPTLLGMDLTIADSRLYADGYEFVACQAGVGQSKSNSDTDSADDDGDAPLSDEDEQQPTTTHSSSSRSRQETSPPAKDDVVGSTTKTPHPSKPEHEHEEDNEDAAHISAPVDRESRNEIDWARKQPVSTDVPATHDPRVRDEGADAAAANNTREERVNGDADDRPSADSTDDSISRPPLPRPNHATAIQYQNIALLLLLLTQVLAVL